CIVYIVGAFCIMTIKAFYSIRKLDDVTLFCRYASEAKYLLWYKQVAGEQPQIISSFYKHSISSFHNQFQGNQRFSVQTGQGFYHLKISDIQDSDAAMYYCGQNNMIGTEFDDGTLLVLKGNCFSSCLSFLQQPESDSVQTGGSATLNCTVLADGKRSVYWFKKDSESSHLGIISPQTNSSSRCVKNFESPEQRCVFSLPKRNVSLSDAGMYYCAVASCGEILFGKGTRLNVEVFLVRSSCLSSVFTEKQRKTFPVVTLVVVSALVVSPQPSVSKYTTDHQVSSKKSPQHELHICM
uniref:Ig-like domain-containing protein n=1 Tax=Acanthochromis polyacanthus TaxID=80966 RepID=A0A3Q1EAJ9_9TELE